MPKVIGGATAQAAKEVWRPIRDNEAAFNGTRRVGLAMLDDKRDVLMGSEVVSSKRWTVSRKKEGVKTNSRLRKRDERGQHFRAIVFRK